MCRAESAVSERPRSFCLPIMDKDQSGKGRKFLVWTISCIFLLAIGIALGFVAHDINAQKRAILAREHESAMVCLYRVFPDDLCAFTVDHYRALRCLWARDDKGQLEILDHHLRHEPATNLLGCTPGIYTRDIGGHWSREGLWWAVVEDDLRVFEHVPVNLLRGLAHLENIGLSSRARDIITRRLQVADSL